MLNADWNSKGEITWSQGEQSSVIDYIPVTDKTYRRYNSMYIDKQQVIYGLLDHNLLEAVFKVEKYKRIKKEGTGSEKIL